jgi:flagellar biosynthesis/type III secretory pathway protein FliH
MFPNLSNSEILARAQAIRARTDITMLSPEDSQICFAADCIINGRRSSGIAGIVESALQKIVGERRSLEMSLEKARRDEAAAEALLAERAGLEKNLIRQREVLERLRQMATSAASQATPAAEEAHFLSRLAHADHHSLGAHLQQVALEIAQSRIIAQYSPLYVAAQNKAVTEAEARLKEISKQVAKL